jgi:glucose-6-phosphate 1-dehydrogenase
MELKDNTIIVVLGASGDLAKKKTVCKEANT